MTQLTSAKVGQLPISGDSAPELNAINANIARMNIQSVEDSKYDNKTPMNEAPVNEAPVKQGFCTVDLPSAIAVIG
jgi:hypothetical protein